MYVFESILLTQIDIILISMKKKIINQVNRIWIT